MFSGLGSIQDMKIKEWNFIKAYMERCLDRLGIFGFSIGLSIGNTWSLTISEIWQQDTKKQVI